VKQIWLSVVMIVLASCAAEIPRQPTTLIPSAQGDGQSKFIQVDEAVDVRLPSGYSRSIRAGSIWQQGGTVEGRVVYKATKDVFTIEGTHVHEAYLLLDGDAVVGFYLPGEGAVSWLKDKVTLKFH
jgi:hypothetical protein